jgi:hypothetical protein
MGIVIIRCLRCALTLHPITTRLDNKYVERMGICSINMEHTIAILTKLDGSENMDMDWEYFHQKRLQSIQ